MTTFTKPSDINNLWAESGSKTAPSGSKRSQGWVAEKPSFQNMNSEQYRKDLISAYINQRGIVEWDNTTEYVADKSHIVGSNGYLYKARTTNTNVDPITDSGVNWKVVNNGSGVLDWNINLNYSTGSLVLYDDSLWVSQSLNSGITPTIGSTDWEKVLVTGDGGIIKTPTVLYSRLKVSGLTYVEVGASNSPSPSDSLISMGVEVGGGAGQGGALFITANPANPALYYYSAAGATYSPNVRVWDSVNLTKASEADITSGINNVSFITPKGLKDANIVDVSDQLFGSGQTFEDLTLSSNAGVTYTNTSDKPRFVTISMRFEGIGVYAQLLVNTIERSRAGNDNQAGGIYGTVSSIVLPGDTYRLVFTGTPLIINWSEVKEV